MTRDKHAQKSGAQKAGLQNSGTVETSSTQKSGSQSSNYSKKESEKGGFEREDAHNDANAQEAVLKLEAEDSKDIKRLKQNKTSQAAKDQKVHPAGWTSVAGGVWSAFVAAGLIMSWEESVSALPIIWIAIFAVWAVPLLSLRCLAHVNSNHSEDTTRLLTQLEHRLSMFLNPEDTLSRTNREMIEGLAQQLKLVEAAVQDARDSHGAVVESLAAQTQGLEAAALQAESAKRDLLTASETVTSEIDAAASALQTTGLKQIKDASEHIHAAGLLFNETFETAAQRLETLSTDSDKINKTQLEKIDAAHDRLSELTNRAGETSEALSHQLQEGHDKVAGALSKLEAGCRTVGTLVDEKITAIDGLNQRLNSAANSARTEMDLAATALEKSMVATARRGEGLSKMLNLNAKEISEAVSTSEGELIETADKLYRGAESLKSTVETIGESRTIIEATLAGAQDGVQSMLLNARRDIESLCQGLSEAGSHLKHTGDETGEDLAAALETINAQLTTTQRLSTALEEIKSEAEMRLEATLADMESTINKFQDVQASMEERMAEAVDRSEGASTHQIEKFQAIDLALNESMNRLTDGFGAANNRFAGEMDRFRVETDRALQDVGTMLTTLEAERNAWSETAEASGREGAELVLAMKRVRESILDPLEALYQRMETVGMSGNEFAERIEHAINQTADHLQNFHGEINGTSAHFTNVLQEMGSGLSAALSACNRDIEASRVKTQELIKPIELIRDTTRQAESQFNEMSRALTHAADSFEKKTEQAKEVFHSAIQDKEERLRSGLESVQSFTSEFQSQLAEVGAGLEAGETQITQAGAAVRKQASSVTRSAEQASGKLNSLAANFERRKAEMSVASQEIESRISGLVEKLGMERERMGKVSVAVGGTVDQAATNFRQKTADLKATADIVVADFSKAAEGLDIAGQGLVQSAGKQTEGLGKMATWLGGVAEEQSTRILKSGEALVANSRTVHGEFSTIAANLGSEVSKASDLIANFESVSDEKTSKIEAHGRVLSHAATGFQDSAAETVERVEKARVALLEGAQGFGRVGQLLDKASGKLLHSVSESTQSFSNQVEQLNTASMRAAEQADVLNQASVTAQQEQFFDTARFLVESLNSIAVDISRLLESDVPEKVWNQLAQGEGAVFTRRLAAMRKTFPMDNFVELYERDVSFRNYVLRFIGEYEQLVARAADVDRSDVLQSLFRTSDLGKVYLVVCSAIDKEPVV